MAEKSDAQTVYRVFSGILLFSAAAQAPHGADADVNVVAIRRLLLFSVFILIRARGRACIGRLRFDFVRFVQANRTPQTSPSNQHSRPYDLPSIQSVTSRCARTRRVRECVCALHNQNKRAAVCPFRPSLDKLATCSDLVHRRNVLWPRTHPPASTDGHGRLAEPHIIASVVLPNNNIIVNGFGRMIAWCARDGQTFQRKYSFGSLRIPRQGTRGRNISNGSVCYDCVATNVFIYVSIGSRLIRRSLDLFSFRNRKNEAQAKSTRSGNNRNGAQPHRDIKVTSTASNRIIFFVLLLFHFSLFFPFISTAFYQQRLTLLYTLFFLSHFVCVFVWLLAFAFPQRPSKAKSNSETLRQRKCSQESTIYQISRFGRLQLVVLFREIYRRR